MQAARGTSIGDTDTEKTRRPLSWRHLRVFVLVAVASYAVDVTTKWLAVRHLVPGRRVPLVGDLLSLDLVRNPGAAFSTGTGFAMLFSFIAIAASVAVVFFAVRLGSVLWAVGLGLLLGGVVGNLTDRVFRAPGFLQGHVVDFLRLPHWPVFNFADMFIDLAAAVVIIQALRGVGLSGQRTGGEEPR